MYIRGLIPRNFAGLAEAVPIGEGLWTAIGQQKKVAYLSLQLTKGVKKVCLGFKDQALFYNAIRLAWSRGTWQMFMHEKSCLIHIIA